MGKSVYWMAYPLWVFCNTCSIFLSATYFAWSHKIKSVFILPKCGKTNYLQKNIGQHMRKHKCWNKLTLTLVCLWYPIYVLRLGKVVMYAKMKQNYNEVLIIKQFNKMIMILYIYIFTKFYWLSIKNRIPTLSYLAFYFS